MTQLTHDDLVRLAKRHTPPAEWADDEYEGEWGWSARGMSARQAVREFDSGAPMPTLAIIELILAGIEQGAVLLPKIIDAAKQSGELTDEQATAFATRMEVCFQTSAWTPDPPDTV